MCQRIMDCAINAFMLSCVEVRFIERSDNTEHTVSRPERIVEHGSKLLDCRVTADFFGEYCGVCLAGRDVADAGGIAAGILKDFYNLGAHLFERYAEA